MSYIHNGRNIVPVTSVDDSLEYSLSSYNCLTNVKDIEITNNSISFLTDNITLSSLFYDTYNKAKQTVSTYSVRELNDLDNFNLNVRSTLETKGNYLITCPLSSELIFNVVPMKNTLNINEEKGWFTNFRDYKSLAFSNACGADNNDLFIEYKTDYMPVNIQPDEEASFSIQGKNINVAVSSLGLAESGAIGGSQPLDSDVIYLNRFDATGIPNRTNFNGTPLCLWLSGSYVLQGFPKQWMERWYDPNNITQGDALISKVNTSPFSPVVDIPSSMSIRDGDTVTINRLGPQRNLDFIDYFATTQKCCISAWGTVFKDELNGVQGFIEGTYPYHESELILDGSVHGHIPPVDNLLKEYDFTTSFWTYKDDWMYGPDSQIFGNFSNFEGYSVNYNTGGTNSLLTFPTNIGMVYGFNPKGYKIFEKDLQKSAGLVTPHIKFIATDFFGARWMLDDFNKKIIKLESDDLLREVIDLPSNSVIKAMKLNGLNQLVILDSSNHTISAFDQNGNLVANYFISPKFNNFEIDGNNTIKTSIADNMYCDNNNNIYKHIGSNIYKNDEMYFHVGKEINVIKFDLSNNMWILYDRNKIMKLSPTQKLLFTINLPVVFKETSFEMNFVKDVINSIEQDILWIIFNNNRYIMKMNSNGEIIKRINLNDVVNLNKCNPFYLTTKGDFTDFDIKRKYEKSSTGNISTQNPAFSVKMNLKCGSNTELLQMYYPVKNLRGWVHFSLVHKVEDNTTSIKLYINGIERLSKFYGIDQNVSNIKMVNFGTKVSPFIIGGTSGKLGANKLERSIENEYLVGKFDDLRIHHSCLNNFQILSLANNKHYSNWNDLIFHVPTKKYTCLEQVKFFHMNRPPGHKSNKFNLIVRGFDDPAVQENIENYILANIDNLKPINTILNKVIFK
jgi:hypothetical protein